MDEASALAILRSAADNDRRGDAADALGDSRSSESFEALVQALAERSALVRLGTERGLARRADAGASEALVGRLANASGAVAESLARVLGARRDVDADAWVSSELRDGTRIPAIVEGLRTRRDPRAIELLGEIWIRSEAAREMVVSALHGLDVRPIDALLLQALDPTFHSDPGRASGRVLGLAAARLASRSDALDRARSLLAPDAWGDAFGIARAEAILVAIENAWSTWSRERLAPAPEPGWRTVLAPLARVANERIAPNARSLLRALEWFDRREVFARVFPVLLPECNEQDGFPYPFVVLGFEVYALVETDRAEDAVERLTPLVPAGPRIGFFDRQFAGHACRQSRILGYPMRLPESASSLLVARMDAWWASSSDDMSEADLAALEGALGSRFPRLAEGAEGRVVSAPCSRLEGFEGSVVLGFRADAQPWRAIGDGRYASDFRVEEEATFGEDHVRLLRALGANLDAGAPRAFVLWSSSS